MKKNPDRPTLLANLRSGDGKRKSPASVYVSCIVRYSVTFPRYRTLLLKRLIMTFTNFTKNFIGVSWI